MLLLSWRHTGFSVHNRVRVEPEDQPAVERLARYIMRPPISLDRILWSGEGEVLYRPKGGHDGRTRQPGDPADAFDPAEFLARVIMHTPEPRRHLVRYYGAYSNVLRGKRRRHDEAAMDAARPDGRLGPSASADRDHSPDARALRRSWAQLIKRVYEVDPLVCPKCGGEMRIIAFIIDHDVVDVILRHLAKAESLYLETWRLQREELGAEDGATLKTVSGLAELRSHQGDLTGAETLLDEILETQIRVRGEEHPDTLQSLTTLAHIRNGQGRFKEALDLSERAMEAGTRALGADHAAVLQAAGEKVAALVGLNRAEEARNLADEIGASYSRTLGDDHPSTKASRSSLGELLNRPG